MDLLRFLLLLPVRLVRVLLHGITLILRPLLGNVSWTAPGWMPATGVAIRRRPRQSAALLAGLLVLIVGGGFGWQWYKHRPRPAEPERITFEVQAPAITDYSAPTISFHSLLVIFSHSAAPIERVGKPVTSGVVMQPAIKGEWTWTDDHTLRFQPAEDWPVGRHYEVRFDVAKAFAGHVLMAADHFNFDTRPFEAKIGRGEFYQDPQDATAKKTIVPVNFSYPVDTAQFEKRVALALADNKGKAGPALKFRSPTISTSSMHGCIPSRWSCRAMMARCC